MKKNFDYLRGSQPNRNNKFLTKGVILIAVMLLIAFIFRSSVRHNIQHQLDSSSSSEQFVTKEEVRRIVQEAMKEYIESNPEAIIQSLGNLQQRNHELQAQRTTSAIKKHIATIEDGKSYPSVGPEDAKIKIVSFYDYKCGYCHNMGAVNHEIIKNNPDVQLIFRDFPILGEASEHLSRFALAVYEMKPELYSQVHFALLGARSVSPEQLKALAAQMEIDYSALEKVMAGPQVTEKLKATRALAEEVGILGTPAMVLNGELIKGGVSQEALQAKINQARG